MMAKVLVVEDEPALLDTLQYNLQREGHVVQVAADGVEGLACARSWRPDLIILDLMLPRMSGLDVCRALRAESDVSILMLTAKDSEVDKVVGLEIGADDYVTKPFGMRELMARVGGLLRRSRRAEADAAPEPTTVELLASGDLVVDLAAHRVRKGGQPVELRPKEFSLLVLLMENRGHVLTRNTLLDRVWGYEYFGDTRTVDVHVRWLREKIESDPANPVHIMTVRGVGYRFEE
jgi:DNA-binding response OmpR family regulator